ncbi:lipopolysaccharide biosynthesis protein [Sphingobacterium alkalisoli]|uniref:Lipopolysaccharide biosynthesis protein n=1 Tax=Sphingobacterium alkalisoli TaxID=1874115 RepID=A0A4U0GSD1_9SPHI|nr:glycoside hydrolase family 99-like domain-containing protein [Sphingobacterium alkalisoli]TJY61364.1 lipopolysaccharide biosynthesis protein [Sphingobacterium alkalisoli]GGH30722.1 glycosyl transferase [Sphingobacterium alkalisoli]
MSKPKIIAFYLPQFHPVKENDEWWGEGFTEWTNVGKAKKYYSKHYQPRIPADLGYYDLRIKEVRFKQAEMAREAGVEAFCYWHYWFGNGDQLLEKPLEMVVEHGEPDFPFCLGWANHDWSKKDWNVDENRLSTTLLKKQLYPGIDDYKDHFYAMLPTFKDHRYFKVDGRPLFYIYDLPAIPDFSEFKAVWDSLAQENGLSAFYFVANLTDSSKLHTKPYSDCDGVNLNLKNNAFLGNYNRYMRWISYFVPVPLNVVSYKKAMKSWLSDLFKEKKVYPTIIPNWDHSPRVGKAGTIIHNSTPALFEQHTSQVLNLIKEKSPSDQLVFLKSWNEWAEGNYMEPDLKFGKGYIIALRNAIKNLKK